MDMVAEQKEKVGMRRVREVAIRHERGELAFRYGNMDGAVGGEDQAHFLFYLPHQCQATKEPHHS